MKKIFKLLLVSMMIVITAFSFIGCTKAVTSSDGTSNEVTSNEAGQKTDFIVGFDDTFVPMGFKDENGEIVGFDIDLAKEVATRIGLEVKFQPIDWSMKETELNSGNIDAIWNGYTITEERKGKVAFAKPYLANRQVIITLADSDIKAKSDLAGKKVAAQNGSSSVDAVSKEADVLKNLDGGALILFETNNEALMDLEAGRSEAVVADEILARYYMKERGAEKYNVLEEDFGKEEYGIGFRKTDVELVKKVDEALDAMREDGTCAEISKKWFGENIVK